MTTERSKAIVRGYMEELFNSGNTAAFDDFFSEEVVFNGSKGAREQLDGMVGLLRSALPDIRIIMEEQIAEGDQVVTRVTFRGTHQGDYEGLRPTGKQVAWAGIGIDRIVDGKVVEMWHMFDTLAMLRQLGAKIVMESS